jgi:hypothetical protein
MRSLLGLLWALGGAVVGIIVGVAVSQVVIRSTNASNREGAAGYLMIVIALVGGAIGLVGGLVLYARSAPTGQSTEFLSSGTTGVFALVAAIAVGLWLFMTFREAPLKYDGSMATLEMEFRVLTSALPDDSTGYFFNVDVQTSTTNPSASVSWSSRRTEGPYTIIPVFQGPLYRAGSRFIVVRMKELHDEMFMPPMKRTPNPKADWSTWYKPTSVDPPYGVTVKEPIKGILELRYRVRRYGDPPD